jgi:hypothetical protein
VNFSALDKEKRVLILDEQNEIRLHKYLKSNIDKGKDAKRKYLIAAMWFFSFFEKERDFLTRRLTRCLKVQFSLSIRLVNPLFSLLGIDKLLEKHPYMHHVDL